MKKQDVIALQKSARKWFLIADEKTYSAGSDNCPLCKLYWANTACAGCPVAKHTGEERCGGTPYDAWDVLSENDLRKEDNFKEYAASPLAQRIALAEAHFLNALLPANKRVKP